CGCARCCESTGRCRRHICDRFDHWTTRTGSLHCKPGRPATGTLVIAAAGPENGGKLHTAQLDDAGWSTCNQRCRQQWKCTDRHCRRWRRAVPVSIIATAGYTECREEHERKRRPCLYQKTARNRSYDGHYSPLFRLYHAR